MRHPQDHIKHQEERLIGLSGCANCLGLFPAETINAETDYNCIECQDITFCDCGEDVTKCDYHSLPKWWRWTYNFRANFIYFFKDFI